MEKCKAIALHSSDILVGADLSTTDVVPDGKARTRCNGGASAPCFGNVADKRMQGAPTQ
jgi:hypothetical protein